MGKLISAISDFIHAVIVASLLGSGICLLAGEVRLAALKKGYLFKIHHKIYSIASGTTGKTLVYSFCISHLKGRFCIIMERTYSLKIRPTISEMNVFRDDF